MENEKEPGKLNRYGYRNPPEEHDNVPENPSRHRHGVTPGQQYDEDGEPVHYGWSRGEIRFIPSDTIPGGAIEIIPLGTSRAFTDGDQIGKPENN